MKLRSFIHLSLIGCAVSGCGIGTASDAGYVGSPPQRSAGDTLDDQLIVTKIKSELLADPEVSGLNINVDSFKGIVTLRGVTKTGHEADRALYLAQRTSGVREVRSKLVVE